MGRDGENDGGDERSSGGWVRARRDGEWGAMVRVMVVQRRVSIVGAILIVIVIVGTIVMIVIAETTGMVIVKVCNSDGESERDGRTKSKREI